MDSVVVANETEISSDSGRKRKKVITRQVIHFIQKFFRGKDRSISFFTGTTVFFLFFVFFVRMESALVRAASYPGSYLNSWPRAKDHQER